MTLAADQACPQRNAPPPGPRFSPRSQAPAVLAELHRRAAGEGEVAATVPALAEALSVAPRTVQRAVARLAAAGLIEVARPDGAGWRGVPNLYRLVQR